MTTSPNTPAIPNDFPADMLCDAALAAFELVAGPGAVPGGELPVPGTVVFPPVGGDTEPPVGTAGAAGSPAVGNGLVVGVTRVRREVLSVGNGVVVGSMSVLMIDVVSDGNGLVVGSINVWMETLVGTWETEARDILVVEGGVLVNFLSVVLRMEDVTR